MTTKLTWQMSDEFAAALESQAKEAGFETPDAYLADLVRRDGARLERAKVEAEIREKIAQQPRLEMTEEMWARLGEEIDRRMPRPLPPIPDDVPPVGHDGLTDEQREEHRRRLGGRDACGD